MIVIGVDVRKYSLTAVAVDEVGRTLAELTAGESMRCSLGRRRCQSSGCGRSRIAGM
jgi:hypothetical protein